MSITYHCHTFMTNMLQECSRYPYICISLYFELIIISMHQIFSIIFQFSSIGGTSNMLQASTSSFCIVLVGTFIDKLSPLKPDTVQIVKDRLAQRLGNETPRLCPVSCINNEGKCIILLS
jgi:hypothetical protein